MKKARIGIALAAIIAAPMALASPFEGFGIGLGFGAKATGGDFTSSMSDIYDTTQASKSTLGGENDIFARLDVNYGFEVTPNFIVRVGANLDLNDTDIASGSSSMVQDYGFGVYNTTSKSKVEESDHYSVYIAPGYQIGEKTLVYAKVGYHKMKAKWESSYTAFMDDQHFASESSKFNKSFSGWSFGAGVETEIFPQVFLSAEVEHVRYDSETVYTFADDFQTVSEKVEPTSTIGAIGVTYRF